MLVIQLQSHNFVPQSNRFSNTVLKVFKIYVKYFTFSNIADSGSAITVKRSTDIFQRFCFKKITGKMNRYFQEKLFPRISLRCKRYKIWKN